MLYLNCPFCDEKMTSIEDDGSFNMRQYYCENSKCYVDFDICCDDKNSIESQDWCAVLDEKNIFAVAYGRFSNVIFKNSETNVGVYNLDKYLDLFDPEQLKEFKEICNRISNNPLFH